MAVTAIFVVVVRALVLAMTFTSQNEMRPLSAGLLLMVGQREIQWGQLFADVVISRVSVAVLFTYLQRDLIQGLFAGVVKD